MTDRELPMPPDRFHELLARREDETSGEGPRVFPPDRLAPPPTSSAFARTLLDELRTRLPESGELLVLFEEAALADLEAAAGPVPRRPAGPAVATPGDLPLPPALREIVAGETWLLSDRARSLLGLTPGTTAWLKAAHDLTRGGVTLGVTLVIGHLEVYPERVELLTHVRELHARTRGVREVAVRACRGEDDLPSPLPEALRDTVPWPAALLEPDLARTAAIARLALPAEIAVVRPA